MNRRLLDAALEFGLVLRFGVVSELHADKPLVRVKWPDYDDLQSHWLQVGQRKTLKDKHCSQFDIGEHVACLVDQVGETGLVLCAVYSEADAAPSNDPDIHSLHTRDGAEFEYNRATGILRVRNVQRVEIEAANEVSVKAANRVYVEAPDIALIGDVTVQGNVSVSGDVVAGGISLKHHTHGGVESGGAQTMPPA